MIIKTPKDKAIENFPRGDVSLRALSLPLPLISAGLSYSAPALVISFNLR